MVCARVGHSQQILLNHVRKNVGELLLTYEKIYTII